MSDAVNSFRAAPALLAVAVGAVVLGSLCAPPVFELLTKVVPDHGYPYSRVYHRVAMVTAAMLLFVFRRTLNLKAVFLQLREPHIGSALGQGLACALLPSLIVLPFVVRGDPLMWKERDLVSAAAWIGKNIPAALIISIIEESFFRLILFMQLRALLGVWAAAAISSALYAFVHFMTPVGTWIYPGYAPFVGFTYLGEVMGRMTAPAIERGMFGLFLVGVVLCTVVHRTGRIWLCIGLHAGWVLAIKISFYFTAVAPGAVFPSGVGRRYFLVTEPATWGMILAVGILGVLFFKPRPAEAAGVPHTGESTPRY